MTDATMNRLTTGIDGFDTVTGGGLVRGCAYIVEGPPGAGKTILANQVCFSFARAGLRALFISLLSESHDRMLAHMSSMRFFNAAAVPDAITYISAYPTLVSDGLPGLLRLLHEEARRQQASLVVIDGLFLAHGAAKDEPEFRAFVHELQGIAALEGAAMLALTNQARGTSAPEHTMVDGGIELLDEIRDARAVRTLVVKKQRGGGYLRGRHQFRIDEAGITVFPRLEAVLSREPPMSETTERISTGIDAFDYMIGGGYPTASATVITGPSGTGKTTFGLQFLAKSTPEEPGLLFGFYETPARLRTKARSIGIDIDDLLASGALEIMWQSPAENLVDELGHRLLHAVERRKVKRVFFDGIGPLRHGLVFPDRLPLIVNVLNNCLRSSGTTVVYSLELPTLFMPEQVSTEELSSMVDNVILTYYVRPSEERDAGSRSRIIDREMLVLKIRDSAFDAYPEIFHITGEGVQFGRSESTDLRPEGATGASEGA